MGKPRMPDAPDYTKLLEMTDKNIAANQQMFDRYMGFQSGVYDDQKARSDAYYDMMQPEIQGQLDLSQTMRDRYLEQGVPFENQFLDQITNWDSPERREEQAAQASADMAQSFASERENQMRTLESYGIDPSQTRSAALDAQMGTQQAVATAGAATQARRAVEERGVALGGEALNVYRGMPSSSAASLGAGAGVGTGALGQTGATGSMGVSNFGVGANILGQNQNIATSGWGVANDVYGNQLNSWEMQAANSPLNTAAGLGGMYLAGLKEGAYIHPSASPSGGAIPDDVPVRVAAGEVIFPDETVRYHGLKTLNKLNAEAREAMAIPQGA